MFICCALLPMPIAFYLVHTMMWHLTKKNFFYIKSMKRPIKSRLVSTKTYKD